MTTTTEKETIVFDATDRRLGRLATEIATKLQGKHRIDYRPNMVASVEVVVENSSKLDISDGKLKSKVYDRYSGYPGGRSEETAAEVVERDGYGEIIRRAVYGMLPKNRLRDKVIKNLAVYEEEQGKELSETDTSDDAV